MSSNQVSQNIKNENVLPSTACVSSFVTKGAETERASEQARGELSLRPKMAKNHRKQLCDKL